MNSNSSGIGTFAIIGVALAVVGVAIGYYGPSSSSPTPSDSISEGTVGPESVPPNAETSVQSENAPQFVRIPLSDFDIRDRIQQPQIASDGQKHSWLVWESQTTEDERAVFLATSMDGGMTFNAATEVRRTKIHQWDAMIRGKAAKRSSRMWPHVAYAGDRLFLSWVESNSEDPSQQELMYAESLDYGGTFGDAKRLSAEAAVRPTFAGFAASDTTVAAAWLDHRNNVQQPFATVYRSSADEELVYPGPADAGICPCCHLNVLTTNEGDVFVAFRNNKDGYRDAFIAHRGRDDADFAAPIPVTSPTWEYKGCPHDGPSLAVLDNRIHIVWMDAHTGVQQVYYASGVIGEWNFEVKPIHASPSPQGHASISAATDTLRITWEESGASDSKAAEHQHGGGSGASSAIYMVVSHDLGQTFGERTAISDSAAAFNTRPVLCECNNRLLAAWTSLTEAGKSLIVRTEALSSDGQVIEVADSER